MSFHPIVEAKYCDDMVFSNLNSYLFGCYVIAKSYS